MNGENSVVNFDQGATRKARRTRNTDLERQVLGAVLADCQVFGDCASLDASSFADRVHGRLWDVISRMVLEGRAVTTSTLAVELGPEGLDYIGGRVFLDGLTEAGRAILPHVSPVVEALRETATWRRIQALANDMNEWAQGGNMSADDALSTILNEVEGTLTAGRPTSRSKRDVARAAVAGALEARDPVPTGISSLDYLLHGGLISRRMIGIGGLTGSGKTILLGSISENLNAIGEKHLVFSLETPPEDMEIRNVSRRLDANAAQIIDQGHPDHRRLAANAERYCDQVPDNTIFEYKPGASLDAIHRSIIQSAHRDGIKGFILDYWQLVQGKQRGQSLEEHLRAVANRLMTICRKENLWGIVAAETDQYGRLKLSDSLKTYASLYMRLMRSDNDTMSFFKTEKSNYTRYADTGSAASPGMIFCNAGPHFGDPSAEDYATSMIEETGGDDDLQI